MAIAVNHDFPNPGSLKVVNEEGDPIEGVEIRIYEHAAFFAGQLDVYVGLTVSDFEGNWVDPIILDEGYSWVIHFQKLTEYGPVHIEITT